MNPTRYKTALVFLIFLAFAAHVTAQTGKTIVVTTSMLEHVVREVIPASEPVEVVRLIPPGSCPGHFDLSPRILPTLRKAAVVIRHDYQGTFEDKIAHIGAKDIKTISFSTPGSLLIPSNYYNLAEEIASVFSLEFPGHCREFSQAVESVKNRIAILAEDSKKRIEPWENRPVIASSNQKDFCEWLGFNVVCVLNRPENISPRDFEKLVSANAEIIIGNLQEGAQAALSLGERKGVPVAILSNFPDVEGYGKGYDRLVEENIKRIEKACLSQ